MVGSPATHEREYELALGAAARVSAAKYVTINYPLRNNGAIPSHSLGGLVGGTSRWHISRAAGGG